MSKSLRGLLVLSLAVAAAYAWLTYEEMTARRTVVEGTSKRAAAESLAVANRVQLALTRARRIPYDSAVAHLVVERGDRSLALERGVVTLVRTAVSATWPVGIDTIASITGDTVQSRGGVVLTPASVGSDTVFKALRRALSPGVLVYVH